MAVPKYDELMKPLLAAVKDGEIYKIKDVTAMLAQQLNLSAEDLAEMLPSGRQTVFKNRVGWAKTYLKKAGLLDSPARATIVITEAGKKVVAENPEKIDAKYLERFPSFAEFQSTPVSTEDGGGNPTAEASKDLTPDDQLEDAYKEINESLASDLLTEVLKIPPYTFEKFVVDLLPMMVTLKSLIQVTLEIQIYNPLQSTIYIHISFHQAPFQNTAFNDCADVHTYFMDICTFFDNSLSLRRRYFPFAAGHHGIRLELSFNFRHIG